ncbi:phosphatase PAP2 family protein [Crenobacter sp. SG2305]|uniref:phosphatase PAP2 family protein n=1 Tax=Crenobacter oryzisoli TaxID=3056844 RepID=UPI0025AA4EA9|nr:phosphatase PAP2 family protein [Crenobacter sp. SG2305]MDN0081908.1 phosphatase PAP2 family protein [Crenobacter sp. SG2305]
MNIVLTHFWFKMFGTMGFTMAFFVAYVYLLRHPASQVTIIPVTRLDELVGFQPWALPIYLSLWCYVSLPAVLMQTRREIVDYGFRVALPCLIGLAIFYFWPNAIAPADIDWKQYPGVAFLKNVDTAGNAFPSLHVATAVFSSLWLHWRIRALQFGHSIEWANIVWCVAITYSTMAVKQHVALDVLAGTLLGLSSAWLTGLKAHARGGSLSL